jgi:hypothetical protein
MQKSAEANRARALHMLKQALPPDAIVTPARHSGEISAIQIELRPMPPFLIELTDEQGAAGDLEHQTTPVRVLRLRSKQDRQRLRQRGVSFIDLAGAVHIRVPGFFIDRTDLPPAREAEGLRRRTAPYADKASRVVRTLLMSPGGRRWSTQELATAGEVDVATASRVVRELRRRELIRDESPGQGRKSQIRVPDFEALLADWATFYTWEDNPQLRLAAPVGSPKKFITRLPALFSDERWALTLQAGASLLAPHADFDVIHVYVKTRSLQAIAAEKGWEITPSGRLCLLAPRYQESAWFQRRMVNDVPVVSPVQLALDLWNYPVRGREQARHLVDTVLRPLWESG